MTRSPRPRMAETRSDEMTDKVLKQLVQDELEWEPRIKATDIGVIVNDGIVRLTGHVPSYFQKIAAEAAVKRIKGVRGIVEDLEVRSAEPATSDESIASRLANLLEWDASVPKKSVQIKVDDGYVTLSGEVNWQYQRMAAESRARNMDGVRHVLNQITVKAHAQAPDLKRRIEDALKRQAQLDSNKISVTVIGDKVQLNGSVKAWFEREAIERAVWSAPGVGSVEDHVRIGS